MKVIYTKTFNQTLHRVIEFLHIQQNLTDEQILQQLEELTLSFERRMQQHAFSCQPCRETELLGVVGFREYHSKGFRLIYSVRNDAVIGMLFLHQKQSIAKALTDHCMHL